MKKSWHKPPLSFRGLVVFLESPRQWHVHCQNYYFSFKFRAVRGQDMKWNYQVNVRRRLYFLPRQDIIPLNKSDMAPFLPSLAQKINVTQRPVNSSIICSLSCLIKHISSHPRTNDSHHLSHGSIGCGRTTTWLWSGSAASTVCCCFPRRTFQLLAHTKTVEGWRKKMQLLPDYHTASVWLFWLNSWIHMNPSCISIWAPSPPGWAHLLSVGLVAHSLFLWNQLLQEDSSIAPGSSDQDFIFLNI